MEIADSDILLMDETEVDMSAINAVYVTLHSEGRMFRRIKVRDVKSGMTLIMQLWKYQGELNETTKLSN